MIVEFMGMDDCVYYRRARRTEWEQSLKQQRHEHRHVKDESLSHVMEAAATRLEMLGF